jgi:hypothetical protein
MEESKRRSRTADLVRSVRSFHNFLWLVLRHLLELGYLYLFDMQIAGAADITESTRFYPPSGEL